VKPSPEDGRKEKALENKNTKMKEWETRSEKIRK